MYNYMYAYLCLVPYILHIYIICILYNILYIFPSAWALGISRPTRVSIKTKPNCLCHIYRMPDRIILKLSRYLEN